MKNWLIMLIGLTTLASCDNELDIVTEKEDLTVIYAILDPEDDSNYVRVQRGYLSTDPASVSFNRPDSLYYDTAAIDVVIRQFDGDGVVQENERRLIFDNNIPLQSGTFTQNGHYLYRVPSDYDLNLLKQYEIAVVREDGSEASSRTGLVPPVEVTVPRETFSFRFFNGVIEFRANNRSTAAPEAFQVILNFNYRELDRTTGDSLYKTATITPSIIDAQNSTEQEIRYTSNEFFSAVAGQITPDNNKLRFFENMEVVIWAAASDLVTYYELNEPSSGINQNRPAFEQVINGAGIVSSRTRASRGEVRLEQSRFALDLVYSNATCGLNFVQLKGLGAADTCYCINGEEFCL